MTTTGPPRRRAGGHYAETSALHRWLFALLAGRARERRLDCLLSFHRDNQPLGDFRKRWRRACRAAGFAGRLFHDMRRSAVRA